MQVAIDGDWDRATGLRRLRIAETWFDRIVMREEL